MHVYVEDMFALIDREKPCHVEHVSPLLAPAAQRSFSKLRFVTQLRNTVLNAKCFLLNSGQCSNVSSQLSVLYVEWIRFGCSFQW